MEEVKVIVENKKQETVALGSCWCPWYTQTVMFKLLSIDIISGFCLCKLEKIQY